MDVYLNEKCLEDRSDIDEILFFLCKNLSVLEIAKLKPCTHLLALKLWTEDWEAYFDATSRNYSVELFKLLSECPGNTPQFYYHYITHQDFGLAISENISAYSLSTAADKILNDHLTAILNIPVTRFCERPHITILKSSYDSKMKDELATIPSFENAKQIVQFFLLHKRIAPLLTKKDFEEFSNEYYSFINTYDFAKWAPKSLGEDNKLLSDISFPASAFPFIKTKLNNWKIRNESYEDNVASYSELGGVILELHGYVKNFQLSRHYNHDVYEAGYGNKKLLISLDVENGGFEVIDCSAFTVLRPASCIKNNSCNAAGTPSTRSPGG